MLGNAVKSQRAISEGRHVFGTAITIIVLAVAALLVRLVAPCRGGDGRRWN
jgi:hypothetical protein